MKLGKLLGLGRSFFGGNRDTSYHLNRRAILPKFNDGKNPFAPKQAATAATAAPLAPTAAPTVSAPIKATVAKFAPAPAPLIIPPPAPIKSILPNMQNKVLVVGGQAKAAANPAAVKPGRLGWTTRLNPFRAPAPESAAKPVQAELSLNAVKVVHNDLADADVEVVPVKSRNPAPPMPATLPPARQAWEYIGENSLKSV